jgi:hypothetical protein
LLGLDCLFDDEALKIQRFRKKVPAKAHKSGVAKRYTEG